MPVPPKILANADDLGLNLPVNNAILLCFNKGYLNSTSFLTNTDYFDETIYLIQKNPIIKNIGVHINLTEGKPVTNFKQFTYLDKLGNWDKGKTNKKLNFFTKEESSGFLKEINAQIEKVLSHEIPIVHLDSHHHIHTLPCFFSLFLEAAKKHHLKLRLAQTDEAGNYLKNLYRKRINQIIKSKNLNYTDSFETVAQFLKHRNSLVKNGDIELMFHPDFDKSGILTDHYDQATLAEWLRFLGN